MDIPPNAVAKMIVLEKSLYNSGTSPQDIIHLLQKVADNEKVGVTLAAQLTKEHLKKDKCTVNAKDISAICDLVDAFGGVRVAPEITSKIILLQKAIESGITSPETTIKA